MEMEPAQRASSTAQAKAAMRRRSLAALPAMPPCPGPWRLEPGRHERMGATDDESALDAGPSVDTEPRRCSRPAASLGPGGAGIVGTWPLPSPLRSMAAAGVRSSVRRRPEPRASSARDRA